MYLKFLSVTTSIQYYKRKVLAIKEYWRIKQEVNEVTTNPIQDSRANLIEKGGNDTVQVQPWIPYSKHSVVCLRLVVDTIQYIVQPWVFHDGFLRRDAFGYIEVLIDDEFGPILFAGNSSRSGQAMHKMVLDRKESLFGVYFLSYLVRSNKYEFGPQEV